MARTPSSLAWLMSKLSRAKGQVERQTENAKEIERLLGFHRKHASAYEARLRQLRIALAKTEAEVAALTRTISLHECPAEPAMVSAVRPHERVRFFPYGGMTTAIVRMLKNAPSGIRTIDELVAGLMDALRSPPTDTALLRQRVQARLVALARQGKVVSLDGNWTVGRRWSLSHEWLPQNANATVTKRGKFRSSGDVHAAHWLIRTQQAAANLRADLSSDDELRAAKLDDVLRATSDVWSQHPSHFAFALKLQVPPRRRLQREIDSIVSAVLVSSGRWMTAQEILAAARLGDRSERAISLTAVERALKHALLEGAVEHRQPDGTDVEWHATTA